MFQAASWRRLAGLAHAAHAAPTAVGEPLLQLEGVSKSHDGLRILFSDLTFTLCRGDRMAVIGANGSGKTSMLRLLSGADWPDDGTVNLTKNTIVGFLQQQADIEDGQTALEAVVKADTPIAQAVRRYNALIEQGDKASKQVWRCRGCCAMHLAPWCATHVRHAALTRAAIL